MNVLHLTVADSDGWGNMMNGSDRMDGWGANWWMIVMMVVAIVAVVAVILLLIRSSSSHSGGLVDPTHNARTILADRLAKGEITTDEYKERINEL